MSRNAHTDSTNTQQPDVLYVATGPNDDPIGVVFDAVTHAGPDWRGPCGNLDTLRAKIRTRARLLHIPIAEFRLTLWEINLSRGASSPLKVARETPSHAA